MVRPPLISLFSFYIQLTTDRGLIAVSEGKRKKIAFPQFPQSDANGVSPEGLYQNRKCEPKGQRYIP